MHSVRIYYEEFANGDTESCTAKINNDGQFTIEIYETGDELEERTGDWDQETFYYISGNYPVNILYELENYGRKWKEVLHKYGLTIRYRDTW